MNKPEDIIKNNELIAKFMGGEFKENLIYTYTRSGWFYTPANDNTTVAQSHQFRYHSDWNWLMPVVDKIESLGHSITIEGIYVSFVTYPYSWHSGSAFKTKRDTLYAGIVYFIKWYNDNQKENKN